MNDPKANFDENNAILIDRDPKYFEYILEFLKTICYDRNNNLNIQELKESLPKDENILVGLLKDAEFYQIEYLKELIESNLKTPFYDSTILNADLAKKLVELSEFPSDMHWRNIFRGSRDGFGSVDFHSKCDDVSNTLTICKSTNGYIFGAYTDQYWTQRGSYIKVHFI